MVYIDVSTQEKKRKTARLVTGNLADAVCRLDDGVAEKLLYWLNKWSSSILPEEKFFNYQKLIRYKRGTVVEVDLGFNVGSEQGGLGYALVIENDNPKSSKTVTVIPLGSLEERDSVDSLRENEIFLGYKLFREEIKSKKAEIQLLHKQMENPNTSPADKETCAKRLKRSQKKLDNYQKGTYAILNQICAVSKMRIITPKRSGDALFGFSLSANKLKLIDKGLRKMYLTKPNAKRKEVQQKELTLV